MKTIHLLLLIFSISSCSRAKLTKIEEAMRPLKSQLEIEDSLGEKNFQLELTKHIESLKTSKMINDPMVFGPKKIPKVKYIEALEKLRDTPPENILTAIKLNFEMMEVYGRDEWGEVLTTGYYEPVISGSKIETETYNTPLYSAPVDLITIDLNKFKKSLKRWDLPPQIIGKQIGKTVIPYYDRREIDREKKLSGKNLELAWVDSIEAFFLQIQGSGLIHFDNGEVMHLGFAAQNGHPYQAIGKLLHHIIPKEEMSSQKIKAYLQTLSKEDRMDVLEKNPSYVFFKKIEGDALTYSGLKVSEGRTIATDQFLFPKGAIAYLDIEEPVFNSPSDQSPTNWKRKPRLVFDQDTGGAIKGGDRVDLYFGVGDSGLQKAGVMKRMGKLYYLVPRE